MLGHLWLHVIEKFNFFLKIVITLLYSAMYKWFNARISDLFENSTVFQYSALLYSCSCIYILV